MSKTYARILFVFAIATTGFADTVVTTWNSAVLEAISITKPAPTVSAREIAIVDTCIFDAWAPYTASSVGTQLGGSVRVPAYQRTDANKQEAISYAAYRCAYDLFPKTATFDPALMFDPVMASLGYDKSITATGTQTPSQIGNLVAQAVIAFRHNDGSNQLGTLGPSGKPYSDYTGYTSVNTPTQIVNPDIWQPLSVSNGQGGFVTQAYATPFWGSVTPFGLTSGSEFRPHWLPPVHTQPQYKEEVDQIVNFSANLNDEEKVIAEYWADFPGTPLPPGHWTNFGIYISNRDGHTLDQDVEMFFALGNSLFDAGIGCWDSKLVGNSVRPITAIHYLYAGQQIYAWAGPGQGTKWIRGEDWQPYQPVTVVTPAFPEWISGHSSFSAAASEVLRQFTHSDYFGESVTVKAGGSAVEPGYAPLKDVTLHWDTFTEAANEAGLSRRYGGIHFEQGDLDGRALGNQVGHASWKKALSYIQPGNASDSIAVDTSASDTGSTTPTAPGTNPPATGGISGYRFTEVQVPGATSTVPKSLNDAGQVVGYFESAAPCCYYSEWPQNRTWQGFLLQNGAYTTISVPGAQWTAALSVDNSGHVFGVYYTAAMGQESTFTYDVAHAAFTLGNLSWTDPVQTPQVAGMSTTGAVADYSTQNGSFSAVNGTVAQIPGTSGETFVPAGINAQGEIVGSAQNSQQSSLLTGGQLMPVPKGLVAYGIGASAQVFGTYVDQAATIHGAVFQNGLTSYVDDPNPPQFNYCSAYMTSCFGGSPTGMAAVAMNSSGQVLGAYLAGQGFGTGVLGGFVATPTAPAASEATRAYIDAPGANVQASGTYTAVGWAVDNTAGISAVNVKVDGVFVGVAVYGASRPDVCAAFTNQVGCPNVGWSFAIDTTQFSDGPHNLQIVAVSQSGMHAVASTAFTVANAKPVGQSTARMNIDTPATGATVSGQTTVAGWAFDPTQMVTSIAMAVDGVQAVYPKATMCIPRNDVCQAFGNAANCLLAGWSYQLDTTPLPDGPHQLSVIAVLADSSSKVMTIPINVANNPPMRLYVDSPNASTTMASGVLPIVGWAFDTNNTVNVSIAIDGITNEPGDPASSNPSITLGVSRPDVCAAYPNAYGCPNVGWSGALDTTQLANGSHTFTVTARAAYPNPSGGYKFDTMSSAPVTFAVNNTVGTSTRVFIDQPASGQVLSNMPTLNGWALDDNAMVTRLDFFVDGNLVGSQEDNGSSATLDSRPDVCAVYPGRPGCPYVGWHFNLNTTALSNGVHTLAVVAVSAKGSQATTSTTFNLQNGAGSDLVYIDSPGPTAGALSGKTTFAGWAIHDNAAQETLTVLIDGAPFGTAVTNGSRVDVCAIYSSALGCPKVGWSIPVDTTLLTNGVHKLQVSSPLGTETAASLFTVTNSAAQSPLAMYIDAPSANQTVGGVTSFGGWAVDANTGISTVTVSVDGVLLGNATYGSSRMDVCSAFPKEYGCPGGNVGWNFAMDTKTLTNGTHTLAVTATSTDNVNQTIGTSFTVAN